MSPEITTFNDIKIKDYRKSPHVCNKDKVHINQNSFSSNLIEVLPLDKNKMHIGKTFLSTYQI